MKEANIEPRDLETLDETLFQHPSGLVFLKDTEHRLVRANGQYASLFETTLPDRSPSVSSSVSTAIEELLDNAVTHSDRETPFIDVRVWVTDDVVRIRVADDGPGIPTMEREVLSGQADIGPLYHGSGLGLWLVNLVVSDVDGVLDFEDIEPRGSAVTIRLPI